VRESGPPSPKKIKVVGGRSHFTFKMSSFKRGGCQENRLSAIRRPALLLNLRNTDGRTEGKENLSTLSERVHWRREDQCKRDSEMKGVVPPKNSGLENARTDRPQGGRRFGGASVKIKKDTREKAQKYFGEKKRGSWKGRALFAPGAGGQIQGPTDGIQAAYDPGREGSRKTSG